jgi:hypothetical protein
MAATMSGEAGPLWLYHVDIGDWYRATGEEVVVRAHVPLAAATLGATLPLTLAGWQGQELGPSAEIDTWYDHPEVQVRRQYQDAEGHTLWLTAIGARGAASFRIFEHTPPICYTSQGWEQLQEETRRVPLATGSLPVRQALFRSAEADRLVAYWYQWDSPSRDAADGIVSWRLATPVDGNLPAAQERLEAFVQALYAETVPWRRF